MPLSATPVFVEPLEDCTTAGGVDLIPGQVCTGGGWYGALDSTCCLGEYSEAAILWGNNTHTTLSLSRPDLDRLRLGDVTTPTAKESRADIIYPWDNGGELALSVIAAREGVPAFTTDAQTTTLAGQAPVNIGELRVADLNQDGLEDVLQPDWDTGQRLSAIVAVGSGFAAPNTIDISFGNPSLFRTRLADVDGDGGGEWLAFWTADRRLKGSISSLWDDDQSRFFAIAPYQELDTGETFWERDYPHLRIGDFNGDGRDDILHPFVEWGYLVCRVYVGDTVSPFTTMWEAFADFAMDAPHDLANLVVGDLNGDGRDDLLLPWENHHRLALNVFDVDLRRPILRTAWWGTTNQVWDLPRAVILVGDVDGDAKDDIVYPWVNAGSLSLIFFRSNLP